MLNRMTIRAKLVWLAVIVALLLLVPYFFITGNLSHLEDKGDKSAMASDLINLVQQVRIAEQNYEQHKSKIAAQSVENGIAEILEIADVYRDKFEQRQNQKSIELIAQSAKKYSDQFSTFIAAIEAAQEKETTLVKEARELEERVLLIRKRLEQEFRDGIQEEPSEEDLTQWIDTLAMANELIRLVAETRIEEKNFIRKNDKSHLSNVDSHVKALMALASEYVPQFENEQHQEDMRMILANSRTYLAAIQYYERDLAEAEAQEQLLQNQALKLETNALNIQDDQNEEEAEILKDTRGSIPLSLLSILILSTFLLTTVARDISKRIRRFLERADQIAKGVVFPESEEVRSSGVDEMVLATNSLWDINAGFRETVRQAEEIAEGDYNAVISLRSQKDILGEALNKMVSNLRNISAENEHAIWLREGINHLSNQIRGDLTYQELSQRIVDMICPYVGAPVAACYVFDPEDQLFKLTATFSCDNRGELRNSFALGEGLVGQAAKEKKLVTLTDVPEDYMRVRTAMFVVPSREVIAAPFVVDNKVVGIIEIATTREFAQRSAQLLETVSESIAIAINSAHAREALHRANSALEQQALTLAKSEESLKDQRAELQATNEELQTKTAELEQQKTKIEEKNLELDNARKGIEKQAEALRAASKYKSEFLANMSHELRTPLNSLLILAQNFSENKDGNLTNRQVENAKIIHSSGHDLLQLINDILDLSKVEAGQMTIHPETVHLQDLSNRIRSMLAPLVEEKGLEFLFNIKPEVPAQFISDRQRLEQILKNLLSNSVKFTSKGSVIVDVEIPSSDTDLSFSGLNPSETIAFSVTDTGIGIPEDKQNLIFEAFHQADGSTSRNYGGTGLGLSISRELIRLLGGEISLKSKMGEGSTFIIYLPAKGNDQHASSAEGSSPRSRSPIKTSTTSFPRQPQEVISSKPAQIQRPPGFETLKDDRDQLVEDSKMILVIEDDPAFAGILYELCKDRGLQCILTPLGREGLEFVNQYNFMGVLLDLHLPDMDGWTVLSQLKEDVDHRHIPVHILSADEEDLDAYSMGAIGFLSKPVNKEELSSVIDRIQSLTDHNTKELLIVENNDDQRNSLINLIGDGEVSTTAVATASEALEEMNSHRYQCVVLDLNLPDKSGPELLEYLTQGVPEGKLPPIIVYTGQQLTSEEEAQLRKYAETVIIKGVRSEERLLDEASLFLHRVVADLPEHKRRIIQRMHSKDAFFAGKKVLLVDDDIRNIYALSGLLEESGMEVIRANDGQKAIETLKKNPEVDIVLMDIMMPIMDGYEACRQIRKMDQFRNTPIIALTAKAMKEDHQLCLDAGASDYLPKPIDGNRLLSIIRAWLY